MLIVTNISAYLVLFAIIIGLAIYGLLVLYVFAVLLSILFGGVFVAYILMNLVLYIEFCEKHIQYFIYFYGNEVVLSVIYIGILSAIIIGYIEKYYNK